MEEEEEKEQEKRLQEGGITVPPLISQGQFQYLYLLKVYYRTALLIWIQLCQYPRFGFAKGLDPDPDSMNPGSGLFPPWGWIPDPRVPDPNP